MRVHKGFCGINGSIGRNRACPARERERERERVVRAGRILFVVNSFDAMVSSATPRNARTVSGYGILGEFAAVSRYVGLLSSNGKA